MFEKLKSLLDHDVPIQFHSMLTSVRDEYLLAYRRALASYRQQFTPSAPEVTFKLNRPDTPIQFQFYRVDLASGAVSPPNLTEVNLGRPLKFKPQLFRMPSGLSLTMHPFVWSGIDFITAPFPADSPELASWCLSWLDPDDKRPRDSEGFSGVIHVVTMPTRRGDQWMFSVDFGTAPIAAFEELLAVLHRLGVESVTAGSFHFYKRPPNASI